MRNELELELVSRCNAQTREAVRNMLTELLNTLKDFLGPQKAAPAFSVGVEKITQDCVVHSLYCHRALVDPEWEAYVHSKEFDDEILTEEDIVYWALNAVSHLHHKPAGIARLWVHHLFEKLYGYPYQWRVLDPDDPADADEMKRRQTLRGEFRPTHLPSEEKH